jgi:hypothetical protein
MPADVAWLAAPTDHSSCGARMISDVSIRYLARRP